MRSERVINYKIFAKLYNKLASNKNWFFPEPSELMNYLYNRSGSMFVISSPPSHGKTSLMLSLIIKKPEIPVLFFSLEMSYIQLINRLLHVSGENYIFPNCFENSDSKFIRHKNTINVERNIYINDASNLDSINLLSAIDKQQASNPVNIIFIDYFQWLYYERMLVRTA